MTNFNVNPTRDETALLKLRDLINQIEAGEKPSFILIENEDAPCPCGRLDCGGFAKQSQAMIYNMHPIEAAASCAAVTVQKGTGF